MFAMELFRTPLVLLLLFFCVQERTLAQTLYIDGEPPIVDISTGVRYAVVRAAEDDTCLSVDLSFSGESRYTHFDLDGMLYKVGETATVLGNKASHRLLLEDADGKRDTLALVLTTLPVVTMERVSSAPFSLEYSVPVRFTLIDPFARTERMRVFESNANVCFRGATAAKMDKKSYKVEFVEIKVDSVKEERDADLLGIRETDSWILDAAAIDPSRMRNRVCFDLWNEVSTLRDGDMLRNGTRGYFCEVFIDGEYNGLYCLSDKVNRSLLGLKKTKLDKEGSEVKGLLYKCRSADTFGHSLQLSDNQLPPPIPWRFTMTGI